MFMGIGDAECDQCPLQVSQFEADIRIAEQLTKIYFEGHGGGYALAWYFAAQHTSIDCFNKRAKKGYIFTIGDEKPTPFLKATDLEKVLGYKPEKDFTQKELLAMVSKNYEVFHLIIEEGSYCRSHRDRTVSAWTKLLGQHARPVSDHTKIAEIIVSILQKEAGEGDDKILESWDPSTSEIVARAINYSKTADLVIS
jgi:hypothetical protein